MPLRTQGCTTSVCVHNTWRQRRISGFQNAPKVADVTGKSCQVCCCSHFGKNLNKDSKLLLPKTDLSFYCVTGNELLSFMRDHVGDMRDRLQVNKSLTTTGTPTIILMANTRNHFLAPVHCGRLHCRYSSRTCSAARIHIKTTSVSCSL